MWHCLHELSQREEQLHSIAHIFCEIWNFQNFNKIPSMGAKSIVRFPRQQTAQCSSARNWKKKEKKKKKQKQNKIRMNDFT